MESLLVLSLALTAEAAKATRVWILLINICMNSLKRLTYGMSVTGAKASTGARLGVRGLWPRMRTSRPRDIRPGVGHLIKGLLYQTEGIVKR